MVQRLYANELARRGYVTLAFDPSFTGESGGSVRDVASPDIYTEDYSAAVDFLGLQKIIDLERIGAMAVCGLSGMALRPRPRTAASRRSSRP
ncbi:alpha/beta hydrolase [Actinophytocola sp.]|uniref:alpha/beta hydrolase n=1 Tax=Actinophytocola sp. TaxID=1872138 RepID=UPI00389AB191